MTVANLASLVQTYHGLMRARTNMVTVVEGFRGVKNAADFVVDAEKLLRDTNALINKTSVFYESLKKEVLDEPEANAS